MGCGLLSINLTSEIFNIHCGEVIFDAEDCKNWIQGLSIKYPLGFLALT